MITYKFEEGTTMEGMKREILVQTLDMFGGNKMKTAHFLGITVKSVYNILNRVRVAQLVRAQGKGDSPEDGGSSPSPDTIMGDS